MPDRCRSAGIVRRHLRFVVVIGVAAAAFSACAPYSQGQNMAGDGKAPVRTATAVASAPAAVQKTAASPPAAQTESAPLPQPVNPERFLRMRAGALSQRLGEPDFLRRDGNIEVWQYRSPNCITDLFLYPEQEADGAAVVRHVEIRAYGGADEAFCRLEMAVRMRAG